MLPTTSETVFLKNAPLDECVFALDDPNSTFQVSQVPLPILAADQLLLQAVYFSNDAGVRGWIQRDADQSRFYTKLVEEGSMMRIVNGIWRILSSTSSSYVPGQYVLAGVGWTEYAVIPASEAQPIKQYPNLSMTARLGVLGHSGLSAYFGLTKVLQFKKGQRLVVSAAAGAVGIVALQYAKNVLGASQVIGIAGSSEKCEWLLTQGVDVALDYTTSSFVQDLERVCDYSVDAFFDNVGGSILNSMLPFMKVGGRIAQCGTVSTYNSKQTTSLSNYQSVVRRRVTIQGFLCYDWPEEIEVGKNELAQACLDGKVQVLENVVTAKSMSEVPEIWSRLFSGNNKGKLITRIELAK